MRVYTCAYTCMCIYVCVYMYVFICMSVYMCVHVCVCVCVCALLSTGCFLYHAIVMHIKGVLLYFLIFTINKMLPTSK